MSRKVLSVRQRMRLDLQNRLIRSFFDETATFQVLDLGTEFGHTGKAVKDQFPGAVIDGVEIHEPTLQGCREDNGECYDSLHLADGLEFLENTTKFWDVIVAAEIIEHLQKDDGFHLLDLLVKRCKLAIVTSPIGFKAQGELYGNPHQVHVSGWTPEEFTGLEGWKVYVLHQERNLGVYYFPGSWTGVRGRKSQESPPIESEGGVS